MSGLRTKIMLLAAVIGLGLCASTAHAGDSKTLAKQHFADGEAKFKAGDYRGAISEFQAADALVPSPILSYNIGLCHEKLGEPEAAIQRFQDYLRRRPDAPNRSQVEGRIARIEGEIAAANDKKKKAPEPEPDPKRTPDLDDDDPAGGGGGGGDGKPGGTIGPSSKGGWVDKDSKDPAVPPPDDGDPQPEPGANAGGGSDPALSKRLADRRANASPDHPTASGGVAVGADAGRPAERAPPVQENNKKAKPAYKEWWFWVVVGVAGVILISMLSDDGSPNNQPMTREAPGGAVLFSF